LKKQGRGIHAISLAVGVSRNTVRRVLRAGRVEVPEMERAEKAELYETRIRALYERCQGNLVRVHEELAAGGVALRYSTLTAFCRRRGIGQKPKERAGRYHFEPGEEMQHDTSPHEVLIGGRLRRVQCASLVLCYSRRLYAQVYPVWNRFWAKVFLTEAIVTFEGAADRTIVDNASILVARGTGKDAVMAPEIEALGTRFGTTFVAHELGDVNRSARVERPFDYIERNFYAGREFADIADCSAQLRAWCDKVNAIPKKELGATPLALFATERTALHPLPGFVPPVYQLHRRTVDVEGYIHLHTNRYSVPTELIDHEVSVHETKDQVRLFDGHRLVCEHVRQEDGQRKRCTLPGHEKQPRWHKAGAPRPPSPEEQRLRASCPVMAAMVDALQKRHGGRATRILMRLHRLWLDYPEEPLRSALTVALEHGLFDLGRIETLVLRHVAGDFFRLPTPEPQEDLPEADNDTKKGDPAEGDGPTETDNDTSGDDPAKGDNEDT
jgi:transposase